MSAGHLIAWALGVASTLAAFNIIDALNDLRERRRRRRRTSPHVVDLTRCRSRR